MASGIIMEEKPHRLVWMFSSGRFCFCFFSKLVTNNDRLGHWSVLWRWEQVVAFCISCQFTWWKGQGEEGMTREKQGPALPCLLSASPFPERVQTWDWANPSVLGEEQLILLDFESIASSLRTTLWGNSVFPSGPQQTLAHSISSLSGQCKKIHYVLSPDLHRSVNHSPPLDSVTEIYSHVVGSGWGWLCTKKHRRQQGRYK